MTLNSHSCREEMECDLNPDMFQCQEQECLIAVEEWRAEQAALRETLFYGYEAYASAYSSTVTIDLDVRWGATPRSAGDIHVLAAMEQRDAWVAEGPTLIKKEFGYVVKYRARSASPGKEAPGCTCQPTKTPMPAGNSSEPKFHG